MSMIVIICIFPDASAQLKSLAIVPAANVDLFRVFFMELYAGAISSASCCNFHAFHAPPSQIACDVFVTHQIFDFYVGANRLHDRI